MMKINLLPTADDRYQHQKWYVRLWRRRHLLSVPVVGLSLWYHEHKRKLRDENDWYMSYCSCCRLAIGLAHGKMNWYHTSEELGYDFSQHVDD